MVHITSQFGDRKIWKALIMTEKEFLQSGKKGNE